MTQKLHQLLWSLSKSIKMGHTYRKEKTFDEKRDNKPKKRWHAEVERKTNKNQNFIDVIYEDDEFIEYEDEYDDQKFQHNRKK
jgi:hypothetical protein